MIRFQKWFNWSVGAILLISGSPFGWFNLFAGNCFLFFEIARKS